MVLFEICYAEVTWNGCADERPWLLVRDYGGGDFGCFPISGACYSASCFYIDSQHPDFSATGLMKSCSFMMDRLSESALRNSGDLRGS